MVSQEQGPLNGVTSYTRWGSRICTEGRDVVYTGVMGGHPHNFKGGGANFLCMPLDPVYTLPYVSGIRGHAHITAIVYGRPINGIHQALVACTICHVQGKTTSIMIPAKTICPDNWTIEYYGYLMTGQSGNDGRYTYECVDKDMDTVLSYQTTQHGEWLYHVEVQCNRGLECSTDKYSHEKEMNCVVCSK